MTLSCQGLDVIYTNDIIRCQLCHCIAESNGNMTMMQHCKHSYHIKCLIEYCSNNSMICPECSMKFDDIRISLAVAYSKNDTQSFLDVLMN